MAQSTDAILHGGGMTWMTGTYDRSSISSIGHWQSQPVLAGKERAGDNLYTCSIVALDPDTGKLAWYFQPSPHDVHDWDAVETPVLFDAEFKGKQRKLLAQASRNGFFFLLDRTNGQHLVTAPFIDQTWASGIDSRGRPIASQKLLRARTARSLSLDQTELAIGWRQVLILRPASFMSMPAESLASFTSQPQGSPKVGEAETATSGPIRRCARLTTEPAK